MAKKPDPLNDLLAKSFTAPPKPVAPAVPAASPKDAAPAGPTVTPPEAPAVPQSAETASGAGDGKAKRDTRPKAAPQPRIAAPAIEPVPDFEGVKKTTVSFYATEQAQVDEILELLRKARRHRGGFSDAIKIALRLCPMDPEQIGKAWDAARAADKRTQRGKP